MIPLLEDEEIKKYDVLAIQEPWRNPYVPTTYNPSTSGFHLIYNENQNTRVCFYVNKNIDINDWSVEFPSPDMATLMLNVYENDVKKIICISNVYNPSPTSPSSANSPSTLPEAQRILTEKGKNQEHILLGDFNLHHPYWGGTTCLTQDNMSDYLIDIATEANLQLTLPRGTITWEARNSTSTIDLIFMTTKLTNKIEHCKIRNELDQSSDHKPISTKLLLGTMNNIQIKRRAWKSINMTKIESLKNLAPPITHPINITEIDEAIKQLERFLNMLIEHTVPWAKPWNGAQTHWSRECSEAVAEARRLRREWSRTHQQQAWENYNEACKKKKKVIAHAKKTDFRRAVAAAAESRDGIWKLAKWARDKSDKPKEIPRLPTLMHEGKTATTFDEQIAMFKEVFFPPPPEAETDDIHNSCYPGPVPDRIIIEKQEVKAAINKTKADKAAGPDGIPNRMLKVTGEVLIERLTPIFQACADRAYHPRAFKEAHTITLKKLGKSDYTTPKAYRPIALLNTMGKILESIMAQKITSMAEANNLLPHNQMGARKGRGTDTALQLLTEQIHTIWGQGNDKVASILSLDIAGAFDHVSHIRLIHNMRKRKIPTWITNWVESFLKNRTTTITVGTRRSTSMSINTGIPQGSPISPILFLFFNADLLDVCSRSGRTVSAIGFVDDVNILTYGTQTESNCRILGKLHDKCQKWARTHGATFAPQKYELIHLTKTPKKFNMEANLQIDQINITPKLDIRVLGVQIDSKLKWGPHIKKIQDKMTRQTMALTKICASTWGASMLRARHVYTAVVRPAMTYGSVIWLPEENKKGKLPKWLENNLGKIQNNCLRKVTGAYKATPIKELEKEAHIMPLPLHMQKLKANFQARIRDTSGAAELHKAKEKIRQRLKGKKGRPRKYKETPDEKSAKHLRYILTSQTQNRSRDGTPMNPPPSAAHAARKAVNRHYRRIWKIAWINHCAQPHRTSSAIRTMNVDKSSLRLHKGLSKAESALAIQVRTEVIGLANFLYRRRVPSVMTPACRCGHQNQTAKHVIMECPNFKDHRQTLRAGGGALDYRSLLDNNKGLKKMTKWLMQTGLLEQFKWANDNPYENIQ